MTLRKLMSLNTLYGLVLLLVVLVLGTLLVAAVRVAWTPSLAVARENELPGTLVTLLLTGVTVSFLSAIVVPRALLRRAVEEVVDEEVTKVKKEIEKKFESEAARKYENEIRRTDAHLSRMVAYFLSRGPSADPLWAMGWILRSARRYQLLDPERIGIREYGEFVAALVDLATDSRNTLVRRHLSSTEPTIQLEQALLVLKRELTENGMPSATKIRKVVRLFKDYFDLEISLHQQILAARASMLDEARRGRLRRGGANNDAGQVIPLKSEHYALFRMAAMYQGLMYAFFAVLYEDGFRDEYRSKIATSVAEISYALKLSGLSPRTAQEYQERIKDLQSSIAMNQIKSLFSDAVARAAKFEQHASNPRMGDFDVALLVDPRERYRVSFSGA